MARENEPAPNTPAPNTMADPTVPGPRQYEDPPAPPPDGAPETVPPAHRPGSAEHPLAPTRLGGAWVAIGCFIVVLLFLLFFILGNNYEVSVRFFGLHFGVPLGVALVLAAVCGALLVLLAGAARIMQMRSRVRKHRKAEHKARKRAAA